MKYFVLIGLVLVAFALVGCKKEVSKATLYTEDSKLIRVIEDAETIDALVDAWKAKEVALEKILPVFEHKLELELDGKVQTWMFHKAGYLMQEGGEQMYKTPKTDVLMKITQ